ncbi:DUF4179 domain-containing protein [Anaerosporobacter faecicola]|uniref:DUF4179 domain-containing protein n=1 Tax=Anaerosporobacter faecicola TaxID=2718714 RepID=UPI001438C04A|nr:DUF4179 domain-containing protein [Anaerosporobacter faecicola]
MDNLDKNLDGIGEESKLLNNSPLSEEQQRKIFDKTMQKIHAAEQNSENNRNSRGNRSVMRNKKVYLLVALVACLGISVVICAATFGWNNKLARYFGSEEDQDAQQKATVINLDQADTQNGITVSTVQLIGDQNGFSILLRITTDAVYGGMAQFEEIEATIEGANEYTVSNLNPVGCEEEGDYYVLNVRTPEEIQGKKIHLQLKNYGYLDLDTEEFTTKTEGVWNLEWTLAKVNSATTYEVNKEINLYGGTAIFDSVSISPISVTVEYSHCKNFQIYMTDGALANDQILVKFLDGTVVNSNYTDSCDFVYDKNKIGIYLKKIISMKDVESITFAGVTVPINKNPNPLEIVDVTSKEMNIKIGIPKQLYEVCEEPVYREYQDEDFDADAKSLMFIGKKDGVEMPLFTIIAIHAEYTKKEVGRRNPMVEYLDNSDGWIYVISYGEIQSQEQLDAFTDLLNQYVENIKQRVEISIP